jgi:hypothetical protein
MEPSQAEVARTLASGVLPAEAPAGAGWQAVRVDRYGLVLAPRRGRCASRRLRVAFPRPVDSVPDLARTLHRILCHGDRVGHGPRSHSSR